MFPCVSTVMGEETNVCGSMVSPKGLKRASTVPLPIANRKTVPPAPGTHTESMVSAAWNTGCQPPSDPPASGSGFQSLANDHIWTNCPFCQCRRFSFHTWLNQLSLPQGNGV